MPGVKLQKRSNDFFVSYSRRDTARVAPLVDLLKNGCGFKVWFDRTDNTASETTTRLLGDALNDSRGAIFFLSETWTASNYCEGEHDLARAEQREHPEFVVVAVRLDEVEPPSWFKIAEIVDLRQPGYASTASLLRSLTSFIPRRFDAALDVYLAAPWSRPSDMARKAFQRLARTGWRLIGDTPEHMYLGEDRIKTIQSTTRGVVALLPFDPTGREGSTNGFILDEARMALSLGKPLLVLNEPGVSTPDDIVRGSFQGRPVDLSSDGDGAVALMSAFDAFEETAFRDSFDDRAFVFYAGSLLEESADAEDIETVIERFSNMRCVRGEKLPGDNVQRTIIDHIRRAAVVVADVSDDNRNTLIEAGIAMGAGTRLKLICRTPDSGQPMKKRFMFEGQELFWYRTAEERLALCCYFARQFRRRVYVIR